MALLAAPRAEQEDYLRVLGTFPSADELALEFNDEFMRVRTATYEGSDAARAALTALDEALSGISGIASERLWRCDALDDPEWEHLRTLARAALRELNVN